MGGRSQLQLGSAENQFVTSQLLEIPMILSAKVAFEILKSTENKSIKVPSGLGQVRN